MFKVGDKVKVAGTPRDYTVQSISDNGYIMVYAGYTNIRTWRAVKADELTLICESDIHLYETMIAPEVSMIVRLTCGRQLLAAHNAQYRSQAYWFVTKGYEHWNQRLIVPMWEYDKTGQPIRTKND